MATPNKDASGGEGGCLPSNESGYSERLQLHVRCIKGEDTVNLYLSLLDGSVVTLNRYNNVHCKLCYSSCELYLMFVPNSAQVALLSIRISSLLVTLPAVRLFFMASNFHAQIIRWWVVAAAIY